MGGLEIKIYQCLKLNITHSVKVCVRILWHVIIEDNVNSFNVHATAKQVGCHQNPPLEVFELLISG